jgi:CDGSH-type Zn-finger protein
MSVKVVVLQKGPYLVSGDLSDLEIADADGQPIDLAGKTKVFLCRCGASTTKPFCDGTHSKIGFLAAEGAVQGGGSPEA